MWGKIIIPMYRLWLNGLYGLYGPRCPLSSKRPINLISLSLSHNNNQNFHILFAHCLLLLYLLLTFFSRVQFDTCRYLQNIMLGCCWATIFCHLKRLCLLPQVFTHPVFLLYEASFMPSVEARNGGYYCSAHSCALKQKIVGPLTYTFYSLSETKRHFKKLLYYLSMTFSTSRDDKLVAWETFPLYIVNPTK